MDRHECSACRQVGRVGALPVSDPVNRKIDAAGGGGQAGCIKGESGGASTGRVLLSLASPVTQSRLVEAGRDLRTLLNGAPERRAVFAVFIELAQNILRHSLKRGADGCSGEGAVEVAEDARAYVIRAANPVSTAMVPNMRERVGRLRGASRDTIKSMINRRRRQTASDGRAGLGLPLVARYAHGRLSVDFEAISDEEIHMTLTAVVGKEGLHDTSV